MFGLMQHTPLLISTIIKHAARHHGKAEIVSVTPEGGVHRYTYADAEPRMRRWAKALIALGVKPHDRIATLAWNDFRHFETYYAVSGMQAICHTVNPRLAPEDLAYIINHAGDKILVIDPCFAELVQKLAPLVAGTVTTVVVMTDEAHMPSMVLPSGMKAACYEDLLAAADEDYEWPQFDENTASALCYTSGTTGRPKGVLYSHRSTLLHAMATAMGDTMGLCAVDRILPIVPMFHVNAWGTPYSAAMIGASLIFPGRRLDGASVVELCNRERVTMSAGVPTVWLGVLNHLAETGGSLTSLRRVVIGGAACPASIIETLEDRYGIKVGHAWGMTETSPLGVFNSPTSHSAAFDKQTARQHQLKQGRALFGIDIKIVDDAGTELPWDGKQAGNLMIRGQWVMSHYFGTETSPLSADQWFDTGDVSTIDPDGFMQITDRAKDVIKSGGEWISSIELENIAQGHPGVAEACCIGARHKKWDERPVLIVVRKKDVALIEADILDYLKDRIPRWWMPDAVMFEDALPHTATGKVLKREMREKYENCLLEKAN